MPCTMVLAWGLALFPTLGAADDATVTPVPSVPAGTIMGDFKVDSGIQVDVWVDGKRAGLTPFTMPLTPGKHVITASTESLEPTIITTTIAAKGDQVVLFRTPRPVTAESHTTVMRRLQNEMNKLPENHELLIHALYLAVEDAQIDALFTKADEAIPGDPVVDAIRSKIMLRRGKKSEAALAADRSVAGLPSLSFAWRVKANVLREAGDLDGALEAASKSIILEPRGWRGLLVRARVYEARKDRDGKEKDEELAEENFARVNKLAGVKDTTPTPVPTPVAAVSPSPAAK